MGLLWMNAYGIELQVPVFAWLAEVDENFLIGEVELFHRDF